MNHATQCDGSSQNIVTDEIDNELLIQKIKQYREI